LPAPLSPGPRPCPLRTGSGHSALCPPRRCWSHQRFPLRTLVHLPWVGSLYNIERAVYIGNACHDLVVVQDSKVIAVHGGNACPCIPPDKHVLTDLTIGSVRKSGLVFIGRRTHTDDAEYLSVVHLLVADFVREDNTSFGRLLVTDRDHQNPESLHLRNLRQMVHDRVMVILFVLR